MIRKRLARTVTAILTAGLLGALTVAGPVAAKNPSWDIQYTKLPPTVSAGNEAGYLITVGNKGPSNINTLMLTVTPLSTPSAAPSHFSGLDWNFGDHGSCINTGPGGSGPLTCDLGTVVDDQYVTFTVAYHVPVGATGNFDVEIAIQSGSGNTGSDGGSSRGDAFARTASTGINSSQNLDSGFVVGDGTFQTTGNLGRGNKQTTSLETTDALIPVTIEDGITTYPCNSSDPDCAGNLIGEWSVLNVNEGDNDDPIKVTLMIWGGSVPGGVSVDEIYLLHADGLGGATPINADCDASPPTNADCLESVTKVGNNYRIVAWLAQNGGLRGTW